MHAISVREAFAIAPPRRPAVLCLPGADGSTALITTQWFSWLNMKHNPMLSYAMEISAAYGQQMQSGDDLYLAFPPVKEALRFQKGIRASGSDVEQNLPEDLAVRSVSGVPVLVPQGSELILRCTLAGSYRYPFKKVRICNCNLEEAMKEEDPDDFGFDQPAALI